MSFYELLADSLESPRIYLLGCKISDAGLTADFGFISQGLSDRPYHLLDSQGQEIVTIKLPPITIKIKGDYGGFLIDENNQPLIFPLFTMEKNVTPQKPVQLRKPHKRCVQ